MITMTFPHRPAETLVSAGLSFLVPVGFHAVVSKRRPAQLKDIGVK